MVRGLGKFKEYFHEFTEKYVFIGGTACDLLMNSLGLPFRATKDLDIVYTIENLWVMRFAFKDVMVKHDEFSMSWLPEMKFHGCLDFLSYFQSITG
jgi:hypothetical protein